MFVIYSMYKFLPILLFAYGFAVTTEDIYDNSYALIIGIDKYENVRSLDYAVKDAEDVQSMLVDKFHFKEDNIVLLKDEEATQASILQEFSNITKKANDNDRVLIFFAGHGETIDLPDGGEMGFLLPVDGDKTDLYLSAIKMEELRTLSLLSDAKHILYLVDACYGGIVSVGARGLDAESTPNYLDKITKYKSRQIISAGGRGEEVIEKAEWGHSAFTKNLLSGLRDSKADTDSDGIITVQELGTYLQKKVTIDSDNRQTPKTRNLSSDEGEFVFVYAENSAVIKDNSTDAKLDAVLSKLEKLEEQSTADKTKPDLKVNPDKQQFDKVVDNTWDSDYPLVFKFIYIDKSGFLGATKHYDGRHLLGLIYGYTIWEDKDDFAEIDHPTYGDYVKSYIHFIGPVAGKRLLSKRAPFDPIALFSMGIMIKRVENQDLEISKVTNDFYYALSLYNRFIVTKTVGFSLGINISNEYFHNFDGDNKLYEVYERVDFSPVIAIDITNPFSKKKN